ncbi:hydroxyacylglutathione hydrolase [Anaplasmataceae bacterium AB001_6]|nr:hydroxyacylglutathione hydrolase [Anaplasmataceae bacterium AB001_6]
MTNNNPILEVSFIKTLKDNYTYFIRESINNATAIIDPSESDPCLYFLKKNNFKLDYILNTHHHYDHVGGNLDIKKHTRCKIVGCYKDRHRIPGIDQTFSKEFKFGTLTAEVIELDGHTIGHIAIYFPREKILFCGDTLFSSGCGVVLEGTMKQMHEALTKLKNLPDETLVYCAHEYTLGNLRFAKHLEPDNPLIEEKIKVSRELRKSDKPTLPSTIGIEKNTNPFFRTDSKAIRKKLNIPEYESDAFAFAKIRNAKDRFHNLI